MQLSATIALARLLRPSDFGMLVMVGAFTEFFGLFVDPGLSMMTIQARRLDTASLNRTFWLQLQIALVVALSCAAISPVVGRFYGDPRLIPITVVISTSFVIQALGLQQFALLRRWARFRTVAIVEVTATVVASILGISLALMGLEHWALVAMIWVNAAARTVGAWVTSGWCPGSARNHRWDETVAQFAKHISGFNAVNYWARKADDLLLGWVWGASALGLYSRAYQLLLLPLSLVNAPLTPVAISLLSRLTRDEKAYQGMFEALVKSVAWITLPGITIAWAMSDELVLLVLGEQWIPAVRIFEYLALAAFWQPLLFASVWLYISLGRTRRLMWWGIISTPVLVSSFFLGLPWGAPGVALAYGLAMTLLFLPGIVMATRGSPVSTRGYVDAFLVPAVVAVVVGGSLRGMRALVAVEALVARGIVLGILGILTLVLVLVIWREARLSAKASLAFWLSALTEHSLASDRVGSGSA